MKQWYEKLFENYAHKYDSESFTQGTAGECDFIEQELEYDKSLAILDAGCGTGRHAIELSKRGYRVTGVDLSENQLERARQKALEQSLQVDFLQGDLRKLDWREMFDAVLMLCEGGFPLMETDEMNFQILQNVTTVLKPGGKLIFTTLNGLFPLFNSVEQFCAENSTEGNASYRNNRFDLMTFRDHNLTEVEDDDGNLLQLDCSERYYVPSEITWLLKTLGCVDVEIFGAKLGAFSRDDALTANDFEMLVITEKNRQ